MERVYCCVAVIKFSVIDCRLGSERLYSTDIAVEDLEKIRKILERYVSNLEDISALFIGNASNTYFPDVFGVSDIHDFYRKLLAV